MIEELATVLGAATACSKPVSDLETSREHVGQTGKPVATNLYIAMESLSNPTYSRNKFFKSKRLSRKLKFFKVADYGIVGDAFDIVPKLIEKFHYATVIM
jgi:electron transfer flavoprotein alpha subunit